MIEGGCVEKKPAEEKKMAQQLAGLGLVLMLVAVAWYDWKVAVFSFGAFCFIEGSMKLQRLTPPKL